MCQAKKRFLNNKFRNSKLGQYVEGWTLNNSEYCCTITYGLKEVRGAKGRVPNFPPEGRLGLWGSKVMECRLQVLRLKCLKLDKLSRMTNAVALWHVKNLKDTSTRRLKRFRKMTSYRVEIGILLSGTPGELMYWFSYFGVFSWSPRPKDRQNFKKEIFLKEKKALSFFFNWTEANRQPQSILWG